MNYHLKGCLEDFFLDAVVLHHWTNDLNIDSASEDIAINAVNLTESVKNEKTTGYVSSLIIRNNKLDKEIKEINELFKKHCLSNHIPFIDNESINLEILNERGLHLIESATKQLVNNICFNMSKWYDTICLNRPTTTTEDIVKRKTVNKNLCLDFSRANADRPITTYSRNSNNIMNDFMFLSCHVRVLEWIHTL